MKESKITNYQNKEFLKNKDLSQYQHLQVVKDQIETIRQKVFKNDYEPISEVFKIEVSGQYQQKELQKFRPESDLLMSFKNVQEQKQLFAKNCHQGDKKPLKIVNTKNTEILFKTLYKNLKNNSLFPKIIPINTIVLARSYDQLLWPAIIVQAQLVKQLDYYKRFIYKVNFIDLQISYSLTKIHIIEFNSQNIEKIKRFFDSKKLYKALKIAQKMFNQQLFEKNKILQTEILEKIIEREQIPLKIPIKLQNDIKQKPNNFVIETPRLKPQQLILQNDCYQTESDEQVKNYFQKKSPQKPICHDQTHYYQQIHRSQQKSFKESQKDKADYTKNKPAQQGTHLQKYFKQKETKYKQQYLVRKILNYVYRYRKQLKYIRKIKNKKLISMIEDVFQFLSVPLTDFKIKHFSGYSCLVDNLLLLCTEDYLNLKNQDKQFIYRANKVLSKLYHTLNDYEGQNEFIDSLKILQLCKLKNFEENNLKKNKNLSMTTAILNK